MPIPKVDGLKIIETGDDYVKKLLVSDVGGHPRSLEILDEVLKEEGQDFSPNRVVNRVASLLNLLYSQWDDECAETVLEAVLTGQKFERPTDKVGRFTIEDIQQLGLVHLNKSTKMLECPLVWLHMKFPKCCRDLAVDPTLESVRNYLDSERYSCHIFWQSWEEFVARFWVFKANFLDGRKMNWRDLHSGAAFNDDVEDSPNVMVKKLKLVRARTGLPLLTVNYIIKWT